MGSCCRVSPSIRLAGSHLSTWMERSTVREKCRTGNQNTRTGSERTNRDSMAPPTVPRHEAVVKLVITYYSANDRQARKASAKLAARKAHGGSL